MLSAVTGDTSLLLMHNNLICEVEVRSTGVTLKIIQVLLAIYSMSVGRFIVCQ
jgi:hypothetical protein